MKGYKAVNRDGTAKHGDAVYEVGGTYTCDGDFDAAKWKLITGIEVGE